MENGFDFEIQFSHASINDGGLHGPADCSCISCGKVLVPSQAVCLGADPMYIFLRRVFDDVTEQLVGLNPPHLDSLDDAFHPSTLDKASEIGNAIFLGHEHLFWYDGQYWYHGGKAKFELPSQSPK